MWIRIDAHGRFALCARQTCQRGSGSCKIYDGTGRIDVPVDHGCTRIIIWEWQVSTGRLSDVNKDAIHIFFTIHEYRYKGKAASKEACRRISILDLLRIDEPVNHRDTHCCVMTSRGPRIMPPPPHIKIA
jgi:hypothetical protein